MKKLLTVLIVLAAGGVLAQTTPLEPTVRARISPIQPHNPLGLRPQYAYEVHYHGLTMEGLSVEMYKAENPFSIFNPFNPEIRASAHDNVTWDMVTGQADGWSFFTLRF